MRGIGNRRLTASLSWVAFGIAALGIGVFAGHQFVPQPETTELTAPVTYTVVLGSVRHELRFEAQATWPLTPWVMATRTGVVTSIDVPANGLVESGQVLMSVGLRPVVAIPGEIPASRDLSLTTSGPDVTQLQEFLHAEGLLTQVSGTFNGATRSAVITWQRQVGFEPADGVVRQGDVAFFPHLPTTVSVPSGIAIGGVVNPGQPLVEAVTGEAITEIITGAEQAALIPQGNDLIASIGDYSWPGRFGTYITKATWYNIPVLSLAGGPICGSDCGSALDVGRISRVDILVIQVPFTEGPVIPVSALRSDPAGQVTVTTGEGQVIPVTVFASHGGIAVVDGLSIGTEILVFGAQ